MKDRLHKIKQDPERALFSEFKGVSRTGVVTAWVDMLGRQKRVHIAPGTVREGDEQWLTEEINSACEQAREAATLLDFDLAELARELEETPELRGRIAEATETPRESRPQRGPSDDDWFDGFDIRR